MKTIDLKPLFTLGFFLLLLIAVLRLLSNHCFSYFDLGIYGEALARIHWGDLNPFIPGRNLRIFNDHFDPILVPFALLTHWLPSPYAGILIEFILIAFCWYPIRLLRNENKLSSNQANFAYAFLILNTATVNALTWPFHPTTWAFLPLFCMYSFYILERWNWMVFSFVLAGLCREEFPLIGFSLGAVLLFDKKLKPGIQILMTALVWAIFQFVLRPRFFGETSTYGRDLFHTFITHPFGPLPELFKMGSIRMWLERLSPLFLWLSFSSFRQHWRSIVKILIITSPTLGIRYASQAWGFHYGTAALISLFFVFFYAWKEGQISPWRRFLSWALLLIFFLSPTLKNLADGYWSGHSPFAYQKCPNHPDRVEAINEALAWIKNSPYQRVLAENNLAASLLVQAPGKDIYILASPQPQSIHSFDLAFVEKPPYGDTWGLAPNRVPELIELWKADPQNKVIFDNPYLFLIAGNLSQDR